MAISCQNLHAVWRSALEVFGSPCPCSSFGSGPAALSTRVWAARNNEGDELRYSRRMAYVAISRGAYEVQIFTNDLQQLATALGRDVSHESAHAPAHVQEVKQEPAIAPQIEKVPELEITQDFGFEL